MSNDQIALTISAFSMAVAFAALTWTISRDVRRPKINVQFMLGLMIGDRIRQDFADAGRHEFPHNLLLTITNMGPSPVNARIVALGYTPLNKLWQRLRGNEWLHAAVPDPLIEYHNAIPKVLEVGDTVSIAYPENADIVMDEKDPFDRIGVVDSFGNVHWCEAKVFSSVREHAFKLQSDREKEGDRYADHPTRHHCRV